MLVLGIRFRTASTDTTLEHRSSSSHHSYCVGSSLRSGQWANAAYREHRYRPAIAGETSGGHWEIPPPPQRRPLRSGSTRCRPASRVGARASRSIAECAPMHQRFDSSRRPKQVCSPAANPALGQTACPESASCSSLQTRRTLTTCRLQSQRRRHACRPFAGSSRRQVESARRYSPADSQTIASCGRGDGP